MFAKRTKPLSETVADIFWTAAIELNMRRYELPRFNSFFFSLLKKSMNWPWTKIKALPLDVDEVHAKTAATTSPPVKARQTDKVHAVTWKFVGMN